MPVRRTNREGRRHGRGARLQAVLAAAVTICLVSVIAAHGDVDLPGAADRPAPIAPQPTLTMGPLVPATVTVSRAATTAPVPPSYLGLSTEYWSLPEWVSEMPLLERAIALIHPAHTGPTTLRIGGDSADHSFWDPAAARLPRWAFSLAPAWLSHVRSLVRALGVRVILDLNLITDTPAQAANWARAAEAALPPHRIVAFEIGNEPDIYSRAGWQEVTAGRSVFDHPLPPALTATDYVRDFRADASALRGIAPGVPLAGPALARPQADASWIPPLEAGARRWLGMITVHRYPYSECARPGTRAYATIPRLLSPQASQGIASAMVRAVDDAHDAGLALRVTELNSVTCGGRPGVSDSFATALWAPDALFSLMRAGVDSADIHVRANTINAPFALTRAGMVARPLLYGLVLFARSLGPRARLVSTAVDVRHGVNLRVYAIRIGAGTLHLVIIDKGNRSVALSLRLPGRGPASVQRLLAPSAAATAGVTLAGQHLDHQGHWAGRLVVQRLPTRGGGRYTVDVRRRSAALISVAVAPGALNAGY
jgi:hypothetical protein